jgi:hypothetical protein
MTSNNNIQMNEASLESRELIEDYVARTVERDLNNCEVNSK